MKSKPRPYRAMKIGTEEWVEGSLMTHGSAAYILPENPVTPFGILKHRVDPSTLGQSTGETDRNGKPLFEDDVVIDYYADRFVIVWHRAAFRAKNMQSKCMWPLDAGKVTKVGTAFDKAEVLYRNAPVRSTAGSDDDE